MTTSTNPPKIALAFLAHPDDAEILCGGTLLRLADAGWEIHIATATAGDCGSATLPRAQIAAVRRQEAMDAATLVGGTYHCLEERDLNVIFDTQSNGKAIDLFRRLGPRLVFTHPRQDYMLDHEQVHLLARNAAFGFPIPNASGLRLPPAATIPYLYYCDPIDGIDPLGHPVTPTTLIDITDQMDRKSRMLACHASQRQWLRSHHGIDQYIEAMKEHGRRRGRDAGTSYAEAFVQHRGHAFPADDILQKLLGRDG